MKPMRVVRELWRGILAGGAPPDAESAPPSGKTEVHSVPMDGARWRRVDEIYHAALDQPDARRAAFLRDACAGDDALLAEVQSLLEFDARPGELLESPAWNALASAGMTGVRKALVDPGARLGVYRVEERIGAGGMGEVYRAVDSRLEREVALKVLAPEMESNAEWRQRFTREAQAASRLNHSNIVTIYDIGESSGMHFIAMEYIRGRTLAEAIPPGGMPAGSAARYAAQIGAALVKAHAAGVVHRDIKPANIMIGEDGALKVLDFGLAKLRPAEARAADDASLTAGTQAGMILGSAAYMSPEQASGRPVDARCDIFSWGTVLYEMLTGRRAFREDSRFATMAAILHKEPEALPPSVPGPLIAVVARCLRKDPAERFQTMAEAADALATVARENPAQFAAPPSPGETIANYRVLAQLREESSGIVYKAEDTRLERLVALKLLDARGGSHRREPADLLREARTASALEHSNIGTVYEAGETLDGRIFIATAYYEGGSLRDRIARGIALDDAVEFARQIALALAKAHERGIVHGALHPGCVMLTADNVVKIVDFGFGPSPSAVLYAAPDGAPSPAADIWSAGAILYTMLAGKEPLANLHGAALAKSLRPEQRGASGVVAAIVARATAKDAAGRYSSAGEMAVDLARSQRQARLAPVFRAARWAAAAALPPLIVAGVWFGLRERHIQWARNTAIPQATHLADAETNVAAMALARQAMEYLPQDRTLRDLWNRISANVDIETDPPGASVEVKDYLTPSAPWTALGQTPLRKVRYPWGYSRIRIAKPGYETYEFAHQVQGEISPDLRLTLAKAGTWPPGMVEAPVHRMLSAIASLNILPVNAPFYIDRYEVTNRDYQNFVDAGGYRDRRYWKNAFIENGRPLTWEDAMRRFTDATREPGPAAWEAGHFPQGKGDLPVGGVSWYEASAYAEFAGKSLPSVSHWYAAAYPPHVTAVIQLSNFGGPSLAPPGKYPAVSAGGAYDMGGNAREWCSNALDENGIVTERRFILGGTWRDPPYMFTTPDAQNPFDRSPDNGFRCARYIEPPTAQYLAPVERRLRDYTKEKPVSDEVFRSYQALYAYEHSAPAGSIDAVDDSSPDWIRQRVSYDSGHGRERMPAVLFLPKSAKPPYQTVVYFPGTGAFLYRDSQHDLVAFYQLDYLIRGGRAVLCPVYEGTYERREGGQVTGLAFRDREIDWSKEVERSFDYLETRPDIDRNKFAFMGFSTGARTGTRLAAYPARVKTCLILSSGLFHAPLPPEVDPINFAPRLKVPTLMLNGRYDFTFPVREYQRPLFDLLGAPEKDKKHVLLDYAHNVGALPTEMRREVLAWLDRYLGPVK
jgi:serine/threonine protein kinase/dienelactone hydrolase